MQPLSPEQKLNLESLPAPVELRSQTLSAAQNNLLRAIASIREADTNSDYGSTDDERAVEIATRAAAIQSQALRQESGVQLSGPAANNTKGAVVSMGGRRSQGSGSGEDGGRYAQQAA